MRSYFNAHTHTHYSNIRLLDCINRPKDVVKKAIELGLSGIAFTDHECLCGSVEMLKLADEYPDFKIAIGNEIYLTETRESGQKYYHFILIAKDIEGHKILRELSSTAWFNSYYDRRLERVPTLKSELAAAVKKNPGHLIATTACIGGELSSNALLYAKAQKVGDNKSATEYYDNIVKFITFCQDLFGEDFYIECAPSDQQDQMTVNKKLYQIASYYNIKMITATDAHYLTKEDAPIHTAYLNSKDGDREVAEFYKYTYLMDSDEVTKLLSPCFPEGYVNTILDNTEELSNKITKYSLFHKQDIPRVDVKDYPKEESNILYPEEDYPHLNSMLVDDDIQNRYWVNECLNKLKELDKVNKTYLDELEEEARVKSVISEKLETNMFRYPNTLQHYIDMIWDCGSMVGAGRGSSCAALNHYLMGITQLDPIQWNLPFFRYLNDERIELGDIDLDICPSKRPMILNKIKEERGQMFAEDLPQWAKKNLGCTLIATFGTEGTKSAILTACRGYRSADCPDGIDVDIAQYMASLIPQERGFLWSINEVINGNEEKGRKPVQSFIYEVEQYPGLLDIIQNIEGLINKRSSHASGVILFDGDPFEHCAFMKTPKGEIITQFDLHDSEYLGNTKYDFLVTEVQDKLVQAIKFLQEDGLLPKDATLREIYNKYFHPSVLPLDDPKIWDALDNVTVLNTFQFDSPDGSKAAKKIKPRTILEMADANGLMRLMGEEGQERPIDKYCRYKENLSLWYQEMTQWGLSRDEQEALEPYFKPSYGVPPSQEQLMKMLMDPKICHFTLGDANAARKVVGKKQMNKIPALRQKVLDQAASPELGKYVWKFGVGPQMGYSFSVIHALAYSFIGVQTLYIATHWNPIYWNTACLVVNSGSLLNDDDDDEIDFDDEEEEVIDEEEDTDKKKVSTDYVKLAKALGDIIDAGIKVGLVDINTSSFGFKPDVEHNQILFGLKGVMGVSDEIIEAIIANRPYYSPKDFINKVKPKKPAMIALIKGGAFDTMMDRRLCMAWYIWETCEKKSRLNLQNMATLLNYNLIPQETEEQQTALTVYRFNKYLKENCKYNTTLFKLDDSAIAFLYHMEYESLLSDSQYMNMKAWDKVYQKWMDVFRKWLTTNQENVLQELNDLIFTEAWNKYAKGTISAWEMEVLCFYYHEHELTNVNLDKYGISRFKDLPEEPEVDKVYYRNKKEIKLFKLSRICGTCIAKNKVKSIVTILTTDGVVNVKFPKDYFTLFDKQISEKQANGKKKVKEKSWFKRGSIIIVMGIRSGDDFLPKKYANSVGHQLYKVSEITKNNELILQDERYKGEAA